MKITQILKKEKTTEDSLNMPIENENPEMQLGMMAHLYNPSTWELEMSVPHNKVSQKKKKWGGGGQESRMIYHIVTDRLCT